MDDKPWSKQRKFRVTIGSNEYVLKSTLGEFELVYALIAKILHLDHARFEPSWSSLHGHTVVLNPFFHNITHGWNTSHMCTNVTNRTTFHILFNDYLMGYSDRLPNCHVVNGSAVPIDQDSGAYTAELPPQTDRSYEKHLLHNRMLANDHDTRRAFQAFIECNVSHYRMLASCLPEILEQFPLHSTRVDHILYRYNQSVPFACLSTL